MTNRELAQSIGVSAATLSLVINGKPGISDQTRTQVIQRLEKLGLSDMIKTPCSQANHGNTIGFVVYKRSGRIVDYHSFFMLLIESIESYARKFNYDLQFLSVDRRSPMEEQMARLRSTDRKGIIVFATEMLEDDIAYFRGLPIPYVLLDNDFKFINQDCVAINNALGTYQAVEYLARMGHTRIGYLQSGVYINSFGERSEGFVSALRHFNLALNPSHILRLDYTEDGAYQDLCAMLNNGVDMPTAFFSDDDTIAAGAIKAFHERGIKVPDDVSVIGFNNRPLYRKSSPALTTIDVPKFTFGAMAVDLLLKRIAADGVRSEGLHSLKYRIGTELVVRDSVKRINL